MSIVSIVSMQIFSTSSLISDLSDLLELPDLSFSSLTLLADPGSPACLALRGLPKLTGTEDMSVTRLSKLILKFCKVLFKVLCMLCMI